MRDGGILSDVAFLREKDGGIDVGAIHNPPENRLAEGHRGPSLRPTKNLHVGQGFILAVTMFCGMDKSIPYNKTIRAF